jgi:hypothetical protein
MNCANWCGSKRTIVLAMMKIKNEGVLCSLCEKGLMRNARAWCDKSDHPSLCSRNQLFTVIMQVILNSMGTWIDVVFILFWERRRRSLCKLWPGFFFFCVRTRRLLGSVPLPTASRDVHVSTHRAVQTSPSTPSNHPHALSVTLVLDIASLEGVTTK